MTAREVVLDGGSPWGFRLHGGADLNQPLRISRVNPGSKAALRGIREGDFITSINNRSTKDISNAEAHALLRSSGDTLRLGLNEDSGGTPRRRQFRTVHQETHSETVKKSSVTSYTTTSSHAEADNELKTSKLNGNHNEPIASQKSTLSSDRSSSPSTPSTYASLPSPTAEMADNGKRRKRNRSRKKSKQMEKIEETEYRVESPRVKSPEPKTLVKSKSLDGDEVRIQELSEVSSCEDKSECKAIISEVESDVEKEEPQLRLTLSLEECLTEEATLMSPEEELNLRNFLEGLDLVNSPEDAFRQVREVSTMESVKSRRAKKRAAIEQYFTPLAQNPRFLDVISEETSDLSDREQSSLTYHLKQGTPEREVPKIRSKRRVIESPTILVGTKIIEVPKLAEICSQNAPESGSKPEIVFLEDDSNSTTPDPQSEHEEEKDVTTELLSSANSSAPDLRESEVVEEPKEFEVGREEKNVLMTVITPPPSPIPLKDEELKTEVNTQEILKESGSKNISLDSSKETLLSNTEEFAQYSVSNLEVKLDSPICLELQKENPTKKEDKLPEKASVEINEINTPNSIEEQNKNAVKIEKTEESLLKNSNEEISKTENVTNCQNYKQTKTEEKKIFANFPKERIIKIDLEDTQEANFVSNLNKSETISTKDVNVEKSPYVEQTMFPKEKIINIIQQLKEFGEFETKCASEIKLIDKEMPKERIIPVQLEKGTFDAVVKEKNLIETVALTETSRKSLAKSIQTKSQGPKERIIKVEIQGNPHCTENKNIEVEKEYKTESPKEKIIKFEVENDAPLVKSGIEILRMEEDKSELKETTKSFKTQSPKETIIKFEVEKCAPSAKSETDISKMEEDKTEIKETSKSLKAHKDLSTAKERISIVETENGLQSTKNKSKSLDNLKTFPCFDIPVQTKPLEKIIKVEIEKENVVPEKKKECGHFSLQKEIQGRSCGEEMYSSERKTEKVIKVKKHYDTEDCLEKDKCKEDAIRKNLPREKIIKIELEPNNNEIRKESGKIDENHKDTNNLISRGHFSEDYLKTSKEVYSSFEETEEITHGQIRKPFEVSKPLPKERIIKVEKLEELNSLKESSSKKVETRREPPLEKVIKVELELDNDKFTKGPERVYENLKKDDVDLKLRSKDVIDLKLRPRFSEDFLKKSKEVDSSFEETEKITHGQIRKPFEVSKPLPKERIINVEKLEELNSLKESSSKKVETFRELPLEKVIKVELEFDNDKFTKGPERVYENLKKDDIDLKLRPRFSEDFLKKSKEVYSSFEETEKITLEQVCKPIEISFKPLPKERVIKVETSGEQNSSKESKSKKVETFRELPLEKVIKVELESDNDKVKKEPERIYENLKQSTKNSSDNFFKKSEEVYSSLESLKETIISETKDAVVYQQLNEPFDVDHKTFSKPSKERLIKIDIANENVKCEDSRNVEVTRTPEVLASPDIMKLDDTKTPIVITPNPKTEEIKLASEEPKTHIIKIDLSQNSSLQKDSLESQSPENGFKTLIAKVSKESSPKPKSQGLQSPSKEIESFCSSNRRPESLFYSNVLSPSFPSPSPSLSSGSSRATSLCTTKQNSNSIGDITSIDKPETPLTLRELCVNFLMSQPFGADILQELADVSKSIEQMTHSLLSSKEMPQELDPSRRDEAYEFISRTYHDAERRSSEVEITDMSNRLLAIIREAQEPKFRKFSTLPRSMDSARLKAKDLHEWLQLARDKNENSRNAQRNSLQQLYEQQMEYLREKEREIQRELEALEEEKRSLTMPRRFREEDYRISKKGDFAENRRCRPVSMPAVTEVFRQQMYEEYLDEIAAREERKQHKVIKVSQIDGGANAKTSSGIKDEFMSKVKEKQKLGKLNKADGSSGDEAAQGDPLPRHLQEFMDMAKLESENSDDGVWSPGQKQSKPEEPKPQKEPKDEPISPVWTPKSATSSPVVERKEFRPVKFESPVLSRKNRNDETDSDYSQEPPWKVPQTSSDTGIALSSALEKRLPTSHSSPGFNDFPSPRLPKAQNPTITLLQKAREGQLPKGALYLEEPKKPRHEKPPTVGPGEILYKIKNEYTSESDGERPRRMADLGPRKFEGIGPTTRDGMPLILRSEVKDANQSKWYKKMYDTIHKQRPHRDEFVTVRYKQRRGQYPYTSGYLSEPEPGAYDSDYTDYKYATLDRRRLVKEKENDYMSSTMPRTAPDPVGSSVIKHGTEHYRNQPGRIENYIPGHSSISEKEAKEWWDEVMDIFDGWLDDNSALPSYDYMFSRALAKSHLEQQKRVPHTKSFMNQALKESGYESDSTLVFRRRDEAVQQLSPSEQKEAYKIVQKGGDIPLHGFRKPAPERPKDEPEMEYFPISPTLTRIRIHKSVKPQREILCYPVTVHPHPSTVFAHCKRTAPSSTTKAPSPPRRRSSRNNSTLRLISTMKVKTEKLPVCKRHETCFTTTSNVDNTKVKYLRDKITCKLSPRSKDGTKPKLKVSKVVSASPELRSRIVSTLSTTKDPRTSASRIQSRTNVVGPTCCSLGRSQSVASNRKPCKKCAAKAETLERSKVVVPQTRTFGTEKRKVDLVLPKIKQEKLSSIVASPDLLSPTEVKKVVETQRGVPVGTVFKKSTGLLASAKLNTVEAKDAAIPIKVGITEKGKSILKSTIQKPSSPISKFRTKSLSPVPLVKPKTSPAKRSTSLSRASPTKILRVPKPKTSSDAKKLKKSKKEEINGDIVKKEKSTKVVPTKCAGRAAGTEIAKQLKKDEEFGSTDTLSEIQKQKEAIQTDYFFQHLFLRDLSPTPSTASRSSWLLEKTHQLQKRRPSSAEPTIGAMKLYLTHTRPVTDSKFRSLDLARSRSASPKSVTFDEKPVLKIEKRSASSPPKLIFSQTSRPVSPKIERKMKTPTPPPSPCLIRSPSSRKIMQLKSHPVEKITEVREGSLSPKPRNEISLYTCPSISHSTSSIDSCDRKDYQTYVQELLRSSRKSTRFKELNEFYNAIEKFGRLEQTASSHYPRRRFEDEIIDYDRWQEVRTRERAERELKSLMTQLKHDAKEKGFLFFPKEVEAYRWKKEYDRGLRIKEKSVDNIKEEFERLKQEETERENLRKKEIASLKDTYKPLWRGDSVLSLANKMVERRSQSEGRVTSKQKLIDSERMLTHGIGSRLWSSLSSEQVNILKNQLSEIYTQGLQKQKDFKDYTIQVPEIKSFASPLTVRRNSDSSNFQKECLSETEKKTISQSISKEVLDHIKQKSLVLAKETRGAIAAAIASDSMSKSCPSELLTGLTKEEPSKPLIKTDATTVKVPTTSETESDESTRTVIETTKDEIKKKVEYFENVAEQERYSPVIYKPADDSSEAKSPTDTESSFKRHSPTSKSYQNMKEFFGEREIMKFATVPLAATRKEAYNSPERPKLRLSTMRIPSPPISETTSFDSLNRSRSLSPYFSDETLSLVKVGEVRRLKNKFEFSETYPPRLTLLKPRRCKSDPNLYKYSKISIPGQNTGDVELLRCKYEYPAYAGRGRSRHRRGGVVSPTFLRAEDRFMPHINIISKIAHLYSKKQTPEEKTKSIEELAKILGCPVGEVEKLRQKFDYCDKNISFLGHMFTSSPNIKELRDIAPYLAASWIAHRFPRSEDNTRSLSSPESSVASRDTSLVRRRARSSPPNPKKSSILKSQEKPDAKNQPVSRYQPEPQRYKSWWTSTHSRPSVSFKEPEPPLPPPKGHHGVRNLQQESPRKYVENEVTIHYKTPVRQEIKEYLSEDELAHRQAEAMKKIYQEERRRKYLQVSKSLQELQDINSRRHMDNFVPSQKSPIPLNRYDDFEDLSPPVKPRPKSPEPRLMARALYNFVGQTARELTFRKGDLIYVRRQVDKNWYEGELNAMVGLFPVNYVEIVTYDTSKATPRKSHEGQARAKYNFVAQTHLELSLAKGELVVITRRVDDNWFEGRIGGRKGIFPVCYVDVLIDPSDPAPPSGKPVASPAAHSLLLNGSAGGKESMGSHSYTPHLSSNLTSSYHAKPVQVTGYGSLNRGKNVGQALHIETQNEPIPYRALYKYLPQNDDELELLEGDTVYVLEKCDDGWYVGSSERTGAFGTFPGNYVEKI